MELEVLCVYVLRCRKDAVSPWREVVQSQSPERLYRLKGQIEQAYADTMERPLDLDTADLESETVDLARDLILGPHPKPPRGTG